MTDEIKETKIRGEMYQIRDIPADLLLSLKHQAVNENCSLRELILRAIEFYIKSKH